MRVQYLVVCIPERVSVRDIVEYQYHTLTEHENSRLVWGGGYLYEYISEWSDKKPYTHYIIAVNYTPLKEYQRYAIVDQGEVLFSDTLKEVRGSAIPILIERADETHPRTQGILREINTKENSVREKTVSKKKIISR